MIFGALVIIFIGLSLAFLIIPVLRKPVEQDGIGREQQNIRIAREKKELLDEQLEEQQMTLAEYDSAMQDLESSLAIDLERQQALAGNHDAGRWVIWFFIAFVPVLSIFMYYELGEYRVIENPQLAAKREGGGQQMAHGSGGGPAPSMGDIVKQLTEHLRANTEDVQAWFMLGKTYMSLRDFEKAVTAFQRTHDLAKNNPTVMLALADSLAMTRNGNMQGEPEALVKQALAISPNEMTGLWLAGMAAEQANRNREAFDYWTRLLPLLGEDAQSASEVRNLLAQLRQKQPDLPASNVPAPNSLPTIAGGPDSGAPGSSASQSGLQVVVSLADHFALQVEPDDLLFIYAKAASGPPMPLAAKRLKASDLPVRVVLSDSDAMMPQMAMSKFDQVIVGARISKSGNPVGQAGDLFQESQPLSHKSYRGVVELNISQIKQ